MKIQTKSSNSNDRSNVKISKNIIAPLSLEKQRKEYAAWVNGIIQQFRSSEVAERYSSLDEYMSANAFFISATFNRGKMARSKFNRGLPQADSSLEMDAFHNLYMTAAKKALGNHWTNKGRALDWPLAIVAADHNEAKYGRTSGSEITNLHWHAILVSRSSHREKFEQALADPLLVADFQHRTLVDSLDVRPWMAGSSTDYLLKAFTKSVHTPSAALSDLRVYPKPVGTGAIGWGYLHIRDQVSPAVRRLRNSFKRAEVDAVANNAVYGEPDDYNEFEAVPSKI
ncbi:hypothetical protein [Devosia sp. A449]